jgi:hypothetical protein
MFDKITAFKGRLRLWELQMRPNNKKHFEFWERETLMLRNTWKTFRFSNKYSAPLFRIYASLGTKSNYFESNFTVILKLLYQNFKRRIQIWRVLQNWEISSFLSVKLRDFFLLYLPAGKMAVLCNRARRVTNYCRCKILSTNEWVKE